MTDEAESPDGAIPKRTLLERLTGSGKTIAEDIGDDPTAAEELSYPYTDAKPYKRVIGSLFQRTVMHQDFIDAYDRYPLARRIVDMPIDDAFDSGFALVDDQGDSIPPEQNAQAMALYNRDKANLIDFSKLVQLFGHSEILFLYNDPKILRPKPVEDGVTFNGLQTVSVTYEHDLRISKTIPIRIKSLLTNFGEETDTWDPSRFIHSMRSNLVEENMTGQSALLPIYNALDVQVHADWSIGQALWRNAGGLLGLFAPKKKQSALEKSKALKSVANHNAKTVLYIPSGWAVKEILKSKGNIAIQRTYSTILNQIAAGSGIPVSILIGSQFKDPSEQDTRTYSRTVSTKQNNLLTPALIEYFRKGQRAGSIESGAIIPKWNPLEYKSQLDKKREELQLKVIGSLIDRLEMEETERIADTDLVKLFLKGDKKK